MTYPRINLKTTSVNLGSVLSKWCRDSWQLARSRCRPYITENDLRHFCRHAEWMKTWPTMARIMLGLALC